MLRAGLRAGAERASAFQQFADIKIRRVPRKANGEADALASTPLGPLRPNPKPSIDELPLEFVSVAPDGAASSRRQRPRRRRTRLVLGFTSGSRRPIHGSWVRQIATGCVSARLIGSRREVCAGSSSARERNGVRRPHKRPPDAVSLESARGPRVPMPAGRHMTCTRSVDVLPSGQRQLVTRCVTR